MFETELHHTSLALVVWKTLPLLC